MLGYYAGFWSRVHQPGAETAPGWRNQSCRVPENPMFPRRRRFAPPARRVSRTACEGNSRSMSTTAQPTGQARTKNRHLLAWVEDMAKLTQPDQIVWCTGSEEERKRLTDQAVKAGILMPLNPAKRPGCYLHRSNPNDVARVEHLTFICTPTKEGAGPTNNWMAPEEAYGKLPKLFHGSMKGRTMYVIPYVMGPLGSPLSKVGIEITDSVYVVLNMRIMTRMGKPALDML